VRESQIPAGESDPVSNGTVTETGMAGSAGEKSGVEVWRGVEPAIRIERTTCGLRISPDPHTDNPTPQETTNQDAPEMGADGGK
jgi:hypothetical protein